MNKFILAIAISAMTLTGVAHADTGRSGTPAQPDLSRAHALQRADDLFRTFDSDGDGTITRAEARQVGSQLMAERRALHRDVAPGLGGHTLKYLEHAFAHARSVNRQQFEQAMLAHFDQMDLDHDGVVTAAERQEFGAPHGRDRRRLDR